MNFEAVDWKKDVVRGWGYRPDEYTYALPRYAPQPDIQAERYDVLVNTVTVFRSPGWERERERALKLRLRMGCPNPNLNLVTMTMAAWNR